MYMFDTKKNKKIESFDDYKLAKDAVTLMNEIDGSKKVTGKDRYTLILSPTEAEQVQAAEAATRKAEREARNVVKMVNEKIELLYDFCVLKKVQIGYSETTHRPIYQKDPRELEYRLRLGREKTPVGVDNVMRDILDQEWGL